MIIELDLQLLHSKVCLFHLFLSSLSSHLSYSLLTIAVLLTTTQAPSPQDSFSCVHMLIDVKNTFSNTLIKGTILTMKVSLGLKS